MSFEKVEERQTKFICDDCKMVITIDKPFRAAYLKISDLGWSTMKLVATDWEHYCPKCASGAQVRIDDIRTRDAERAALRALNARSK